MAEANRRSKKRPSKMTIDEYILFAYNMKVEDQDLQMENLESLKNDLGSDDPDKQLIASCMLRKILEIGSDPLLQQLIKADSLFHFVSFLHPEELPQFQNEAVQMLSCLSEQSAECSSFLADVNVIPALVKLIQDPEDIVRAGQQALLILGNIAEKSPNLSALVLQNGALEPVLGQFTADNIMMNLRDASWVLRQICNPKPNMGTTMLNQVLHALQQNLQSTDAEILVNTTGALASFPNQVLSEDVVTKLIELLSHHCPSVQIEALEALAHVASGNETRTQSMIQRGALSKILKFLLGEHSDKGSLKVIHGVCKLLVVIGKASIKYTEQVFAFGIYYALVDIFESSIMEIKQEVASALLDLLSCCTPDLRRIVIGKCVKPLCDMLEGADSTMILKFLKGLEEMATLWERDPDLVFYLGKIVEADGLTKIGKLRDHDDCRVSDLAKLFLSTYWPNFGIGLLGLFE